MVNIALQHYDGFHIFDNIIFLSPTLKNRKYIYLTIMGIELEKEVVVIVSFGNKICFPKDKIRFITIKNKDIVFEWYYIKWVPHCNFVDI